MPSISGDGRYVAFDSVATNLMAPSIKMVTPWDNVYMRDRGVEPPKPVQMSLDQTALNFGDLGLNGTKLLTLTITSVGSSDLTVNPGSLTINDMRAFNIPARGRLYRKGRAAPSPWHISNPWPGGFGPADY
ncbi:MAG TPA: hypothetical protein VF326_14280 [Anaerolineaceae bacterium]